MLTIFLIGVLIIVVLMLWCCVRINKEDDKLQHQISDLSDIEKDVVGDVIEYHKSKIDDELDNNY